MKKIIIIAGPTSIGKTKVGTEVAKYFSTDIINADSVQVYKKLNIGSAKATFDEMDGVKNHMLDLVEPTEEYNTYMFQKDARKLINEIELPLIVGGTGLYIKSLITDYKFGNSKNTNFSGEFKKLSNIEMFNKLKNIDEEATKVIHFNNRIRIDRAYDFFLNSGYSISKAKDKDNYIYNALIIVLNTEREVLYSRINDRVDEMFEKGLLNEVEELFNSGVNSKIVNYSIGYKELYSYLLNKMSLEESKELIKKNTRNFAKRQLTWFKNQFSSNEIIMDYSNINNTVKEVINKVNLFINTK